MRTIAPLIVFLYSAAAQTPQAPAPLSSPPTLRITVTLIQVDAVVTDSHGRRVTGLTADDFEVVQDRQPQKVSYFSYIPELEPIPQPPPALDGAPMPVTPQQVKRTVALVVDDMALSFGSIVRVRDALRKYIEKEMQPGDLVAIVRTGGGVALLEQFTTDRRLLLEAVDSLKWRFAGRAGLGIINPLPGDASGPQSRPEMLDYGYTLSALGSLGTLEQVVQGMKQLPGRKSVVLLSESLHVDAEVGAAIDRLTDFANRSNVSIYTVDPRGLQSGMSEGEIALAEPDPTGRRPRRNAPQPPRGDGGQEPEPDRDDPFSNPMPLPPGASQVLSVGGLADLAKGTGGLFFANRNDIDGCIRQATADQTGYYLLGYTPAEGTFETDRAKAKFHRITVRVKRPGLRVRWKSGFTGIPDQLELTETVSKSREQQILEALASPFAASAIRVHLTSLFTTDPKLGPLIHNMVHFDARDLQFARGDDGLWHATIDIVANTYRGVNQQATLYQRVQGIDLPEETYQKALKEGMLWTFNVGMKDPGMFLLRLVIRDHASQRIGSASQFLTAPDTRKGRLAISGIVLQTATPQMLEGTRFAPPVGARPEEWTEGGPALRHYHSGQNIAYGFKLINPKVQGTERKPQATSQIRVYRNGAMFFEGKPQNVFMPLDGDPSGFLGAGVLRLGSTLTPGEYLFQVTVTDPLAKKKQRQATQWIDFEVVRPSDAATGR